MNTLNEIKAELKNLVPFIQDKYSVSEIGIFGSFIRNDQTEDSDLDIIITFNESPSLFQFVELENYLSDKLNVKVDLVMKKALKEHLKKYILDEVVPIT